MIELGYIPNANLDQVVELLLKYKAEGKQASCKFNGLTFYSDTITMDDAYLAVTGDKRDDYYRKQNESERYMKEARRRAKETKEEREARYKRLVESTRVPGEVVEIEEETVVEGLKFILENPQLSQEKLILGLLMLDCNFTYEDYNRQFNIVDEAPDIYQGLSEGSLAAAADVIINVRDSEYGRAVFREKFESLTKRYIRKVTNDDSYAVGDEESGKGSKK